MKKRREIKSSKLPRSIWESVPTDDSGNYLEAATDESELVIASELVISRTSFPITRGEKVGIRAVQTVAPNDSFNSWISEIGRAHV